MKSNTLTPISRLAKRVRTLDYSEAPVQPRIKKNGTRESTPALRIMFVSPAKQPAEKARKFESTKLFIKNMVSIRCKMVVKAELEKLGLHYIMVELGEAEIMEELTAEQHDRLKAALHKSGLELMEDKKNILVEKIKAIIIEMVHYADEPPKVKLSVYLSEKLNHNYTYLSNLFSEVKGVSIEHFFLSHKIERVKELLVYDELTLSEIAWQLHYSSVAHLSSQFKKITGLTPTHFKNMRHKRLKTLDKV